MKLNFSIAKVITLALMTLALTACDDTSVKCIFADEFQDTTKEWLTVRPGGENCILTCDQQCRTIFSDPTNKSDGIINKCIPECRAGNYFTAIGKTTSYACGSTISPLGSWSPTTGWTFTTGLEYDPSPSSLGHYLYSPGLTLNKNESLAISLDPNGVNELALCGIQSAWLVPTPWLFQMACKYYYYNNTPCTTVDLSRNTWQASNSLFTDTGIDARNGDTISISWYGPYFGNGQYSQQIPSDSNLLMRYPNAPGASYDIDVLPVFELRGDLLNNEFPKVNFVGQFIDSGGNTLNTAPSSQYFLGLQGELSTTNLEHTLLGVPFLDQFSSNCRNSITYSSACPIYAWKDSTGKLTTNGFNYTSLDPLAQVNLPKNVVKYQFAGQLSSFSTSFSRLMFRHHGDANFNYISGIGGLTVHVSRMGCRYKDGQKLLYAFTLKNYNGDGYALPATPPVIGAINPDPWTSGLTTAWAPFDPAAAITFPATLANHPFAANGAKLWLAIDSEINENAYKKPNPLYNNPSSLTNLPDELFTLKHRHGQYNLQIVKTATQSQGFVNLISTPINKIHDYLFGSDGAHGIVESVFSAYVVNGSFNMAIRACLVLYITVTGLLFLLGISPISQQEAIPRIIKFAFVALLLSPNAWQFLYQNCFRLFTDGTIEIIAFINGTVDMSALQNMENVTLASSVNQQVSAIRYNVSQAFGIFDILTDLFFNSNTWFKIIALAFSTFIGFFLAVVMVISFGYALVGIFKAVLVYLTSMIGIAILLMVSPLFFTFLLFKTTKTIFDNWLKQLMAFAIQPIVVISGITLLSYMLIIAVYSTLGFTACRACILSLNIPFVINVCLLPSFYTLSSLFMPNEGFGSPLLLITPLFCLLILGQAIYVFSSFGATLANFLVMTSYGGVNLANVADQSNPVTEFAKAGSQALGMDQRTIAKRNKIISAGKKVGDVFSRK
jgi:type IV secretion system protein VirB6